MKKYNFISAWFLSFFSRSLYRDVAAHWRGIGITYLLLLLAVCWIPEFYRYYIISQEWVIKTEPVVEQMPTIIVKSGKASVDKPVPYMILDKKGAVLAIIDTQTPNRTLSGEKDAPLFLLTTQKLYYQTPGGVQEMPLSDLQYDFELNKEKVNKIFQTVKEKNTATGWSVYFYPSAVIGSLIYRTIQILFYGLLGLLFANMLRISIRYQTAVRLSAIAITPVIILGTILNVLGIIFPLQLVLYFVISMFYLYFGVKATKGMRA